MKYLNKLFTQTFAKRFREKVLRNERGDSLVEVVLAMAVLSMVAVGSMMVMNNGNATIQNALERTEIRGAVNTQTQLLTYIHDNDPTAWNKILAKAECNAGSSAAGCNNNSNNATVVTASATKCAPSGNAFLLPTSIPASGASVAVNSAPSSHIATNTSNISSGTAGIWVDPLSYEAPNNGAPVSSPSNVAYVDFYIKACWYPLGSGSGSKSSSVTVVRMTI